MHTTRLFGKPSVAAAISLAALAAAGALDPPPGVPPDAGAVLVPFQWAEPRVVLGEKATNRLWNAEGGVTFMPGGRGEAFDAGPAAFGRAGDYRVLALVGAGWADGTGPHDRFVLEMDGQPAAIFAAKGTGGASNLRWSELNRVRIDAAGERRLLWRHEDAGALRKVQYLVAGLAFVPVEPVAAAAEPPAALGPDGWIRAWLLGGPFGMAGLSSLAPHAEKHFIPCSGMRWDQYWLDTLLTVRWTPFVSAGDAVNLDLPETFAGRPDFAWPVGCPGCAYAHLYVKIPGQMDVLLDFESPCRTEILLNGELLRPDREVLAVDPDGGFDRRPGDPPLRTAVTMQTGVNRLAVKLFFPQPKYRPAGEREAQPAWFKCRFLDIAGRPLAGTVVAPGYAQANIAGAVEYHVDPPDLIVEPGRDVAGRRLGDVTAVSLEGARPWSVFVAGEPVRLEGSVRLMAPLDRLERFGVNETGFDGTTQQVEVYWIAYDFDGAIAARGTAEAAYGLGRPGAFFVDLGKPGRGHYTVYADVRRGTRFVCRAGPAMAVVVDPPTLPLPGVHSRFAHSFYYIFNANDMAAAELSLRLLALAKVRWNLGSAHKWWIAESPQQWADRPPGEREWPRAPRPELLARARQLGIEITGDLGGFSRGSGTAAFAAEPERADHLIINDCWDAGPIDGPEAARLIDAYAYETVNRFKGQYRYWRLDNEMNLRGFTPAELVRVHQLVRAAMKRADPEAKLWSGSISSFDLPYVDAMLQLGWDRCVDVHDYHYYIWPQEDPTYADMGGLGKLEELFDRYGASAVPLANGEFGCYRSIHADGSRAQAAILARGLVVAHTYPRLQWIAPHFPTGLDFCACSAHGVHPVYLAYRTAADLLEGAQPEEPLRLGDGIAAWRFRRPSGSRVIVLWDVRGRTVSLPEGTGGWRAFDMLGRPVVPFSAAALELSLFPVYVTDGKLEEGVEATPLDVQQAEG